MTPETIAQIYQGIPYFAPELVISITFLLVLVIEIISKKTSYVSLGVITIIGLLVSMFYAYRLYGMPEDYIFFRMVSVDPFAIFFKFVFGISTILIVLFSFDSEEIKQYNAGEYYCLIIAVQLGMNLLASANNLLMIWLALELVSIPSYLLSGFLKKDKLSAEASLKFVIYGSVSTAVMLFGLSYLYGITGSYELNEIRTSLAAAQINPTILLIILALIFAGIGYKIAAVPFHFWCPDVYEGSPTVITAFFSIGPKAAGMSLLIRFFYGVFAEGGPTDFRVVGGFDWPVLMGLISAVTMTVGNVVAIWQTSIKRMLAYSSIAHVGYMMMGFVLLKGDGIQAILFYLLVYLVMNLGAFLVVVALSSRMQSDHLSDYRGLISRNPMAASLMALFMLSLIGIPGLGGFVGKFYLFMATIDARYYWLVVIAALNSVISFVYYGGVIKRMFLEEGVNHQPIVLPRLSNALLGVLGIAVIVMGLYWGPFAQYSQESASLLLRSTPIAQKK